MQDPDRVLPVDVLRKLEKEGRDRQASIVTSITTVGNGTAVASAKKLRLKTFGKELQADGVRRRYPHLYVRHLHTLRCNDG